MRPNQVAGATNRDPIADNSSLLTHSEARPSFEVVTTPDEIQLSLVELDRLVHRCADSSSKFGNTLEFYATYIDHSPIAFLSFTVSGVIQFANLSAAKLLGLDREELTGRQFSSFIAEVDRVAFSSLLSRCFVHGDKQTLEMKLAPVLARSREVRLEATGMPDGQLCSVAIFDITDSKIAEQSRVMRDRAIQAVNQAIMITDPSQNGVPIVYTNDGFERLTGYSTWQANGRGIELLVGKKDRHGRDRWPGSGDHRVQCVRH